MKRLGRHGITLVELLIYLGISTIMLVVVSEFFVSILDESMEAQNYSSVQSDGIYVLNRFKNALNNADAVTIPTTLGSTSDELVLTVGGTTHRYHLSEGKILFNDGTGDYLVSNLDTQISSLSFTRTGNIGGKPVILIEFTSSSGVENTPQREETTFKGAGGLR